MVLVNGKQTDTLLVFDRGLQYGDGVCKTIAVNNKQPQFLKDHLNRLKLGCQALSISVPDSPLLESEIQKICYAAEKQSVLKIIITRGLGGRGYRPDTVQETNQKTEQNISTTRILSLHPWGEHIKDYQQRGIHLQCCQTRLEYNPQLAGFKHLNRLEQVLGSSELTTDAQEGLMLDFTDHVIEGTMSNPDLSQQPGCGIKGIMRQKVMDWLKIKQYKVTEEPLKLDDVLKAQSIFMSNSIIGIWPVATFENRKYSIPGFFPDLMRS